MKVSGNTFVDASGNTVRLRGVNRSGGEFACVQGNGIWDGPMDAASVAAIRSWNVNAVRVPLNSDCWLGLGNVDPAYRGATYQNAVKDYVALLEKNGITPILELHWSHGLWTGNDNHCDTANAECQKPMPDAEYAPEFWKQLAAAYKNDTAVVFDLFNEPYPNNLQVMDYAQSWKCWRDGGADCTGLTYEAAGMQDLLDAVRSTGAQNVVMVAAAATPTTCPSGSRRSRPTPPGTSRPPGTPTTSTTARTRPAGTSSSRPSPSRSRSSPHEIGENTCGHSYIDTLMAWLDEHGASYLGWTWNTWDCSSGPSLISSYDGTPTSYGAGFRAHLQSTP